MQMGGDVGLAELAVGAHGVAEEEVARTRHEQRGREARQVAVDCCGMWGVWLVGWGVRVVRARGIMYIDGCIHIYSQFSQFIQ